MRTRFLLPAAAKIRRMASSRRRSSGTARSRQARAGWTSASDPVRQAAVRRPAWPARSGTAAGEVFEGELGGAGVVAREEGAQFLVAAGAAGEPADLRGEKLVGPMPEVVAGVAGPDDHGRFQGQDGRAGHRVDAGRPGVCRRGTFSRHGLLVDFPERGLGVGEDLVQAGEVGRGEWHVVELGELGAGSDFVALVAGEGIPVEPHLDDVAHLVAAEDRVDPHRVGHRLAVRVEGLDEVVPGGGGGGIARVDDAQGVGDLPAGRAGGSPAAGRTAVIARAAPSRTTARHRGGPSPPPWSDPPDHRSEPVVGAKSSPRTALAWLA